MALDREAIFSTLFDRLAQIQGIVTSGRKLRDWSEVDAAEQPALFLVKGNEAVRQQRGLPPVWTLSATVMLYCRNHDGQSPSVQLNELLTKIEKALERSPEELKALGADPKISDAQYREIMENCWGTTLGGLCSHCWIAGTIETDEGTFGDQAVAAIPIEILAY